MLPVIFFYYQSSERPNEILTTLKSARIGEFSLSTKIRKMIHFCKTVVRIVAFGEEIQKNVHEMICNEKIKLQNEPSPNPL